MAQINAASNQPLSLPPSFIIQFLQRCFPPQLHYVDFPQALTGLDYLKDLETRRRREIAAAMDRLGIDTEMLYNEDTANLSNAYPGVLQWLKSIEEREAVVDALYTQIYIGLRRWILLNELSLLPFNKHNCVAMLNTLYPPVISAPPSNRLTQHVLKQQREGYFKYITTVEKCGTGVLSALIMQGKAPEDDNAWPSIVRVMEHYLQVATSMISECLEITDRHDVSKSKQAKEAKDTRRRPKADSAVSLAGGPDRRPSTRGSIWPSDTTDKSSRPRMPSTSAHGTALEKIARGLMSIGRGKTEATEIITNDDEMVHHTTEKPNRMLRKMRSFGSMDTRSRQTSETPHYDADAMRRHRQQYDAAAPASQSIATK
jgi:hypothetical protein